MNNSKQFFSSSWHKYLYFKQTMILHAYFLTYHVRLLQLSTYILYNISCVVVAIDKGLVGGPIVDLCDLTQRHPFKLKWESCRWWMEKCGFSSVSKILLSAVCEGVGCLFYCKVGPPKWGCKTGCKEEGGLDGPGGEGKKGRTGLLHVKGRGGICGGEGVCVRGRRREEN